MSVKPMYDVLLAQLRQADNVEQIEQILTSAGFMKAPEVINDDTTTSAHITVLSGGKVYRYGQPLEYLEVDSVANTPIEDRLIFTLASGGSVVFPASCGICPEDLSFSAGANYLVAVMDGNVIGGAYTPGVSE